MIDPEMKREIKKEIERQLKILTSGTAGATTMTTEDINANYPGMPTIQGRPVVFPYGFASRAPQGTISVVGQQGEHPGNKMTLGHRDAAAPSVQEGESVVYSVGGYQVQVKNGELFVGKGATLEHMVVGDTLKSFLLSLLQHIIAHTHIGNLGYNTSPPNNVSDFENDQAQYIDNKKILAMDGGRF